jgi:lipoprotein-anchoring transpeptidase ErfK/SrfK
MILRNFFSLCVSVVVACAVPAFAAGTTAATTQSQAASAATTNPDAAALKATTPKPTAVKKPKTKAAAKKTTKKVAKAKKPATDVASDDDNGGFFLRLFGGGIKQRSQVDAKVKAKPVQIEDDPTLPQITSNDGELRSEAQQQPSRGRSVSLGMLPETRALDRVLEQKQAKKQFKLRPEFMPQEVDFSGYKPGTIVIDTNSKFLYLVKNRSTARRYAIAVGREGLQFKGNVTVGDKQEWPRWTPTFDMRMRDPGNTIGV